MTTAMQPRPPNTRLPFAGRVALVTGQIWAVNGGLDM
jgi:hypothetical protein